MKPKTKFWIKIIILLSWALALLYFKEIEHKPLIKLATFIPLMLLGFWGIIYSIIEFRKGKAIVLFPNITRTVKTKKTHRCSDTLKKDNATFFYFVFIINLLLFGMLALTFTVVLTGVDFPRFPGDQLLSILIIFSHLIAGIISNATDNFSSK